MKKLISSEIGANYTQDDARVAALSLFSKTRVLDDLIEDVFREKAGIHPQSVYWLDYGRSGISLVLEALDLNEDDEILLQSFSCVVVPNSTHNISARVSILDISDDSLSPNQLQLQKTLTKHTKVLIWQYNFGITQDMTQVIDLCKKHNIVLIEDCAHTIGSYAIVHGKKKRVGTLGDAAIFSFGRDKVISCTTGGVLAINNKELNKHLAPKYKDLTVESDTDARKQLQYAIALPLIIRPWYHVGFGKRFKIGPITLKIGKTLKLWNPVYSASEKKGKTKPIPNKLNPRLFGLLHHQLNKLLLYQTHRKAIQGIYSARFQQWNQEDPLLRYPLDLKKLIESQYPHLLTKYTKNRKSIHRKVIKNLEELGLILVSNWYTSIFSPAKNTIFGYKKGQCPHAEDLINHRIINLPTNIHVSQSDAHKIVASISSTLEHIA
jgi:dTDP-4-amino-4,6-dideoxygalactose transaminase